MHNSLENVTERSCRDQAAMLPKGVIWQTWNPTKPTSSLTKLGVDKKEGRADCC